MRRLSALLLLLIATAPAAGAQAPHLAHRTIRTEHFAVHFPRDLEPLARRAAADAEIAYDRLRTELVPPRGTIELVVTDNVDYANGYATVFPTNRIVVYAHPPIESPGLRFNADWLQLVVAHELAHLFHLDRSRGLWRGLQYVFGRNPLLFPNNYSPGWLTEGLATYYETRLTGAGRTRGSFHRDLALAAARETRLPRLDEVSGATPVFPGGTGVYVYGSLFLDHLARTRGDSVIPRLVERSAVNPIPFLLNGNARAAVGVSFADAWREFADSLDRAAGPYEPPLHGWRDLTPATFAAEFLRWNADGTLTYTGSAPRERYGAYEIARDGRRRYLGRRNGATPNARMADGTLVYAQPDYVDPYTYRGDLYVERHGDVTRLTRGARLGVPDVRADGRVVAVQSVPGGSRLVLTDLTGRTITPITAGGIDEYWAEPRWSPTGERLAAIRWQRGTSSVTILDAAGRILEEFGAGSSVQSAPVWTPGGRSVVFASDRQSVTQLWLAEIGKSGEVHALAPEESALFWPAISPDGSELAAVRLGARGWHVGAAPSRIGSGWLAPGERWIPAPTPQADSAVATPTSPYSPWRQLLPRFWLPIADGSEEDTRIGFYTLGSDVLGRHGYEAQMAFPVEGHGIHGGASYSYAGLKRPVLSASWSQWYDLRGAVLGPGDPPVQVGHVDRRVRSAALSATFLRPRARSNAFVVLGGGADWRANVVHPDLELDVPPGFFTDSIVPRVTLGAGYSRVHSAPYAISPEDGFTLSLGATNRWVQGVSLPSQVVTAVGTGYRSFPLFGYARHVAALRIAGGYTDERSSSELQVGGTSGTELPIAFGLTSIGEGRRTFPVRGFPAATLYGTRAWSGSAEYRAPLVLPARGLGLLPVFLERTSLAAFADAGSAWCPTYVESLCATGNPRDVIASAGGELRVNLAFGTWDAPFQLRGGVAVPVRGGDGKVVGYLTTGIAF